MMENKLLLVMALDTLLVELGQGYESTPEDSTELALDRLCKQYGLEDTASQEEVHQAMKAMARDARDYRNSLLTQFVEEEEGK